MTKEERKNSLLETYMPLKGGETLLASLEGDAYNVSPNIVYRLMGLIERIVAILTGSPRKVYIIVTDTRVITIETQKSFWVIDKTITARNYLPRAINRVGYMLQRDFLVFKSHYFEFNATGMSLPLMIKSKDGKQKVYEMIYKTSFLAERVVSKS